MDFYAEILYTHLSVQALLVDFTWLNKGQFFHLYSPIWELENIIWVLQSLNVCLQNSLRKYCGKYWDQSTTAFAHLFLFVLGLGCDAPLPVTPSHGCIWADESTIQELQSILSPAHSWCPVLCISVASSLKTETVSYKKSKYQIHPCEARWFIFAKVVGSLCGAFWWTQV